MELKSGLRYGNLLRVSGLLLSVHALCVFGQQTDYDEQIKDFKRNIESTRVEIKDMNQSVKDDQRSFQSSDSIHQVTLKRLIAEKDTLTLQQLRTRQQADTVSVEIEGIQHQIRKIDANTSYFRRQLVLTCQKQIDILKTLPPEKLQNHISALEFLKSEIIGNSVENSEAIERFWQVMFAVNDLAHSIDVYSARSPVTSISGDVYFIRLGLAWLGAVDQQGSSAFIWHSDSTGSIGKWHQISDAAMVANMLKCAKIRLGNAVPEIVALPFRQNLINENDAESEVKK